MPKTGPSCARQTLPSRRSRRYNRGTGSELSVAEAGLIERSHTLTIDAVVRASGLLAPDTLARATMVQAETGERLEAVLTRLGLMSEQALAGALVKATGLPLVAREDYPAEPIVAAALSERFLRDVKVVPLRDTAAGVEIAMVDPLDRFPLAALELALGRRALPRVARTSDVEAALDRLYKSPLADEQALDSTADEADLERMKDLASDAPAIRAVNRLITRAVEDRASDIHLEATEDGLATRFRVDGAMRELDPFPAAMKASLVSRIKVMAGLNIAERRLPQDGRLRLAVRGHDIDLRVATSPTINGESVVMRLLDRSNLTLDFGALGFDAAVLERFREVLKQPHGIVLVTGPTGSGKTTTLYTALSELNAPTTKILTIEDPIEYRLTGVNQLQVAPGIGLSFAAGLRSFLRQDPDIMMVGEVRDLETAQVAVQAALTGHMILSTLHTNSASAAVTRLLDMGVEPFLITSTLNAVLAQRLVRRLCATCRQPYTPPPGTAESFGLAPDALPRLYRPVGCPTCGGSGFRGRIAVLELLVMNDAIAKLVLDRAEAREVQAAAVAAGMRTMFDDGLSKVRVGETVIEEVLRVTRDG